jgi:integrase/recombinase XerD
MEILYQQFIREKQYLLNVSDRTVEGYKWAWKAFAPALKGKELVTKADVLKRIAELKSKGLSTVSVNTYLRSVNAFCTWLFNEGHSPTHLRITRLKEEKKVLQTFSDAQVAILVGFRGTTVTEQRIHTLACLLLDTGIRIDEALSIERSTDIDWDQLLLMIRQGKGARQRVVPFSLQLRKVLFRFTAQHKPQYGDLLFFADKGERLGQRNALRDFKLTCQKLGISGVRCSFHTLRHAFALAYLRNGGDVFRLQRILGHQKLDMTRRYVNLGTEDLQAVHQRFSLFAQANRI